MLLNPLTFHSPETLPEAAKLYKDLGDVKILAGGTFLLNSLKLLKRKGTKTPQHVLSLRKIKELQGITLDKEQMTLKAMTIISDLFESPHLVDNFKVLKIVCRNISTQPIRNMATVGGNLTCRYTWTEMGAVMIALDAAMHFISADAVVSNMSAEDFFKNAARTDKLFTHLTIKRDPRAQIAYRRVRKTMGVDIPLLALCVKTNIKNNQFSNTRVSVNNGTSFAQRDYKLEEFLNASKCENAVAQEGLAHLDTNIYDVRSSDYKKHMFRVSLKSAMEELMANKNEHAL